MVRFVEWMLKTGDPILAYRCTNPLKRPTISQEARFPEALEQCRKKDRWKVAGLLKREDVKWIMEHSMRKEMESQGLLPLKMIGVLREIIEDKTISAETRRKTALDLIDLWEKSEESKSKDAPGADETVIPMGVTGNSGKIRELRLGRSQLRQRQKDAEVSA